MNEQNQNFYLKHLSDNDFRMEKGVFSVWIEVGQLSIQLINREERNGGQVEAFFYAKGCETDNPLAQAIVSQNEAKAAQLEAAAY